MKALKSTQYPGPNWYVQKYNNQFNTGLDFETQFHTYLKAAAALHPNYYHAHTPFSYCQWTCSYSFFTWWVFVINY